MAAGAVAGIALGAAAMKLAGSAAPPPSGAHFQRVTFGRGFVDSARFGPEGQIIYTAAWEGRPAKGSSSAPLPSIRGHCRTSGHVSSP